MPDVWAIDGVQVPARVARNLAYVAGGAAEGVAEPGDFKVTPLDVPAGGVKVAPGGGMVLNRYPGGIKQGYTLYDPVQRQVDVTPTGSGGGRNDLVVARVADPEYADPPAGRDPGAWYEAIPDVPAAAIATPAAALAYCRTLAFPALPLAGITLPASTGTVTAGAIRDLRRVARPRSEPALRSNATTTLILARSTAFMEWPVPVAPFTVEVPEWANYVTALVNFGGVGLDGDVDGVLRLNIAGTIGGEFVLDLDAAGPSRESISLTGGGWIPESARGKTTTPKVEGRLYPTSPSQVGTNPGCHIAWTIMFEERAV